MEASFLISRPRRFLAWRTARNEINIEVATIGAFEENFYSFDQKLGLGLRILIR